MTRWCAGSIATCRTQAPGSRQAHADHLDAPVLGRCQLLLQGGIALELPAVVGKHRGHRHPGHLVEVPLKEHPVIAFAGADELGEVVLVERLQRRDGLDAQPLLNRCLAGDAIHHDGNLDDAA